MNVVFQRGHDRVFEECLHMVSEEVDFHFAQRLYSVFIHFIQGHHVLYNTVNQKVNSPRE